MQPVGLFIENQLQSLLNFQKWVQDLITTTLLTITLSLSQWALALVEKGSKKSLSSMTIEIIK